MRPDREGEIDRAHPGDDANTPNGDGGTLGTTSSASTNISSNDASAEDMTVANSTPLGAREPWRCS
ncbi:hypothetical protein [Sorangium sp. So ce1099]|uniref:hypothetical protein n=1 Tax=Sorangium sp. So ce1099 TaxID=3133331 RepID=UPI003F640D88